MFFDRGEHVGVLYPESLARNRGAEPRVQQYRVLARGRVDRKSSRCRFGEQTLRRVEASEVVQHSGKPGLTRIEAVTLRENLCAASDAHAVRVAMLLTDLLANSARQLREGHELSTRARKKRNRLR